MKPYLHPPPLCDAVGVAFYYLGSECDHLPEAGNNYLGSECDHLQEAGNIYISIHSSARPYTQPSATNPQPFCLSGDDC